MNQFRRSLHYPGSYIVRFLSTEWEEEEEDVNSDDSDDENSEDEVDLFSELGIDGLSRLKEEASQLLSNRVTRRGN
jgi:hypothetical protein